MRLHNIAAEFETTFGACATIWFHRNNRFILLQKEFLASRVAGQCKSCVSFFNAYISNTHHFQAFPHRGFCEEVEYLDSVFEEGRSYCLGSINRECWYLYTFSKYKKEVARPRKLDNAEPDQTIEILMQNLDTDVMAKFSKDKYETGAEVTKVCKHKINI